MPITLAHPATARLDWYRHGQTAASTRPQRDAAPAYPNEDGPLRDAAFVHLQAAYRGHSGIVQGDALAARLGHAGRGGYVELARCIVAGHLFSFRWQEAFWVPLFQFDLVSMTPNEAPRRVLDELQGVFDGWGVACWHVRSHEVLQGKRPLDLLDSDLEAVLAAARADRKAAKD